MSDVIELKTLSEFFSAVGGHERVVVDFAKRNGCVPCARLEPHYAAAAAVVPIPFYKVMLDEIDREFMDYVLDDIGIMSTPTVIEYRYGRFFGLVTSRVAPKLIKELL